MIEFGIEFKNIHFMHADILSADMNDTVTHQHGSGIDAKNYF